MDFIKRHWLIVLFALVFGFVAYRLVPEKRENPSVQVFRDAPPTAPLDVVPTIKKEAAPLSDENLGRAPLPPAPRVEMLPILTLVESPPRPDEEGRTLTQDDPLVKKALSDIKIEVFSPSDDETGKQAAAFLSHNQLPYVQHDTASVMNKERARRMAGSGDGVVIVVDGRALRGFSQDEIQTALTDAVKKRVDSRATGSQ